MIEQISILVITDKDNYRAIFDDINKNFDFQIDVDYTKKFTWINKRNYDIIFINESLIPWDEANILFDSALNTNKVYIVIFDNKSDENSIEKAMKIHSGLSISENEMNVQLAKTIINHIHKEKSGKSTEISNADTEKTIARIQDEYFNLKTHFMRTISHELRTPLNGILGFTHLLKRDAKNISSADLEMLNGIEKCGNELLILINDLLELSQVESNCLKLEKAIFSLNQFLFEVGKIFELTSAEKNIKFSVRIDKNIPDKIYTDNNRLKKVLINVLDNAFKFTYKGEVVFEIKLNGDSDLTFIIQDTGIGISDENIDNIFNSFMTTPDHEKYTYHGTGVGLTLAHRLIKQLGGNISVSSVPEKGSTFFVSLPLNLISA